ncbi:unnamed protein product [Didymodactylos carnosus]|uniref:Uncharacterized protein n=1 Tax=Didymodactylos carnosus TaxID=1234261 RepID=A0A815D4C7_9BILA|nr:unnamed protein product [Didymodactylos carnosus]CAF4102119.1 unnamed protein product [Didymodactylos carnosus]
MTYQFPGQETFLFTKNGVPVYQEPILKIGERVTCLVIKSTPPQLHLQITHIDNKKTSVNYKAILRLQDYRMNVENVHLDDHFRRGDVFDAIVISYGDSYGCYASTISEGLDIVKENKFNL